MTEKLPERNPGGAQGIDPEKIFARFDANGDGRIVAAEIPDEARGMFERLLVRADKNGDGTLTKQELVDAANQLKPPAAGKPGQMDPARMFDYLDKNADGKLSADEIPEGRPMLEVLMKRGDRDGDGSLSREEFITGINVLRSLQPGQPPAGNGPPATGPAGQQPRPGVDKQRLVQRFSQMDADHDGKVSREEFDAARKARFAKIDSNGDGYLEAGEIEQHAAALAQKAADRSAAGPSAAPSASRQPTMPRQNRVRFGMPAGAGLLRCVRPLGRRPGRNSPPIVQHCPRSGPYGSGKCHFAPLWTAARCQWQRKSRQTRCFAQVADGTAADCLDRTESEPELPKRVLRNKTSPFCGNQTRPFQRTRM